MSENKNSIAYKIKNTFFYDKVSDCLERKNKIKIKSSKRLTRLHFYEIELKDGKKENDFTYLIGKARHLFYYLYSLEESKEKLNPLFFPTISVTWYKKISSDGEVGNFPVYSSIVLPPLSLKTFFSDFKKGFLKLLFHDNILSHNCENIKVIVGFNETEYFTKKCRAYANCEDIIAIEDDIERYYKYGEDEDERKHRKDYEKIAKKYRLWKKVNNIAVDEGEENSDGMVPFYQHFGVL